MVVLLLFGTVRQSIENHDLAVFVNDPRVTYTLLGTLTKSLIEPLQLVMDNGGKRVLIPTAKRRHLLEAPGDLLEKVDPIFYSDPLSAGLKGIGVG